MKITVLLLSLLLAIASHAQGGQWDIKDPGQQMMLKCGECLAALHSKPKEVLFGLLTDENNDVWFVLNNPTLFDALFTKPGDGIAVDFVPRSLYSCPNTAPVQTSFYKGTVLKPVYLAELKRTRRNNMMGNTGWKVGHLTSAQAASPYELNLVLLKDHNVCYYNSFYDLARYRWDLLNMGLYMDTLVYGDNSDTTRNGRHATVLRRKTLRFNIPFAKNKATYSVADLQPLYDSLRLTDFNIKRIDIEAYSSVEGPEQRNLELQQQRANSIVSALQSFQAPSIITNVKASENWVEFLRDVLLTSHSELAALPKSVVKERLKDKRIASDLEPILAYHRKAVVTLELQRRDGYAGIKEEELVRQFEQAIADRNLARARELQNSVFSRVIDDELPSSFLTRLDIPAQRDFAPLLNSRIAFKYFEDPRDALEAYKALEDLQRLAPADGHITYNLYVMKFHLWLLGGQTIDPAQFKRDIEALVGKGIPAPLVERMLVNHAIIMAELYMANGDYTKKDERVGYIARNYKRLPLSNTDYLSLAQYFASYANYDMAKEVVEPRVTTVDANEDLLFYFLNLTIFDQERTREDGYRRIMLNAVNKNKQRFCGLFLPFGKGGITFQLLDDPYLMKTYCETCQ